MPITELNTEGPLWVWDKYTGADVNGTLVYYPKEFSAQHGAKTKTDVLADGQHGITLRLLEDMPNIPRKDKGKTMGSSGHERAQLDTAGTSIQGHIEQGQTIPNLHEYLKALQAKKQYEDEEGSTPEEQIMYALFYLEETDQVIDDYVGNGSISYQLGAYFPSSAGVPDSFWDRGGRRADLNRSGHGSRDGVFEVRSAVGV